MCVPALITSTLAYKVLHTDKYLGGGVVDSNAIKRFGACWFLIRRVRGFGPFLPSVESNNETIDFEIRTSELDRY